MRIAAIQMQVTDGDPAANRRLLSSLLDQVVDCDLCLAPELWSCGYVQERWADLAANDTPVCLEWMSDQARSRRIWLGGSLIACDADGSLANRFVLFDRSGAPACQYDKVHLFVPLQEDVYLKPGTGLPPIINVEGVLVAPAICYDLRFPEFFRRMALQDVDLFLVPSEWPHPRQHALRVLTEARAIENQTFVVLANRVGPDGQGNHFCGGSGVFGPLGPLATAGDAISAVVAAIDMDELRQLRATFPVMKHRRQGIDYD